MIPRLLSALNAAWNARDWELIYELLCDLNEELYGEVQTSREERVKLSTLPFHPACYRSEGLKDLLIGALFANQTEVANKALEIFGTVRRLDEQILELAREAMFAGQLGPGTKLLVLWYAIRTKRPLKGSAQLLIELLSELAGVDEGERAYDLCWGRTLAELKEASLPVLDEVLDIACASPRKRDRNDYARLATWYYLEAMACRRDCVLPTKGARRALAFAKEFTDRDRNSLPVFVMLKFIAAAKAARSK